MDQGDGLDELFGEPPREAGESTPQFRSDRASAEVRPAPAPLPTAPPVYQQTFTAPPQYQAAPPAQPSIPTEQLPPAPAVQASYSPPVTVQPIHSVTPVEPSQAPQSSTTLAEPPLLTRADSLGRRATTAFETTPAPSLLAPASASSPRRDPNAPFDFQLRARRTYPRTTAFEWTSLIFAIIVPPIGLILSVIARGLARRQRRWRTRVAGVATVVSIALSLVLAGGVGVYLEMQRLAAVEAALVLKTAPLCNLAEQFPGLLEDPTLGWPPLGASIPESVAKIEDYRTQWNYLGRVLPAEIRGDAKTLANAAQEILDGIETSRTVDGPGNTARMTAVASGTGIPAWAAEYCR